MTTLPIHPDYRAFIDSLTRHRVHFIIVGAHAMAALGVARSTDDLDVLIERSDANAVLVASALREFGGFDAIASAARRQLAEPHRMLTIGRPPVAIDILNSISGVTFEEAWAGRLEVDLHGVSVAFLGLEAFVANKRAAGRPKDASDLDLLREAGIAFD